MSKRLTIALMILAFGCTLAFARYFGVGGYVTDEEGNPAGDKLKEIYVILTSTCVGIDHYYNAESSFWLCAYYHGLEVGYYAIQGEIESGETYYSEVYYKYITDPEHGWVNCDLYCDELIRELWMCD